MLCLTVQTIVRTQVFTNSGIAIWSHSALKTIVTKSYNYYYEKFHLTSTSLAIGYFPRQVNYSCITQQAKQQS